MSTRMKVVLITVIVAIPAFLLEPNSPLGGFWAPAPGTPEATGVQVPLFILLGLAEAIVLGFGVAFVFFGYGWLESIAKPNQVSVTLLRATYVSIAWILLNWWSHDSLHIHVGSDLNGLLAIEYGYHLTLMAAGLVAAWFFYRVLNPIRESSLATRAGRE